MMHSEQKALCEKYGVEPVYPGATEKLGIAISTLGKKPIHGVRHNVEKGTCGWYIWCGETMSNDPDFFQALHVRHLNDYLPVVENYLALPVGYRFLLAGDYVDVWHDEAIDER